MDNNQPPEMEFLLADARETLANTEESLAAAEDCIAVMMSALVWYADPANYQGDMEMDNGRRARLALGAAERQLYDMGTGERLDNLSGPCGTSAAGRVATWASTDNLRHRHVLSPSRQPERRSSA